MGRKKQDEIKVNPRFNIVLRVFIRVTLWASTSRINCRDK